MKNKKVLFLFVVVIIILFSIIFIYKNMIKKSKVGNNMSSQEIVDYILNINSYKAKVTVQVNCNKKTNKYVIYQEYSKENGSVQEVLEPSNIEGTKITNKNGNLVMENTKMKLSTIFENYKGLGENYLDLSVFIDDYRASNNVKSEELNGQIIIETKCNNGNKYRGSKKLYIDKEKLIPTKLVIEDNNQNTTVNIEYNEIELS